MAEYSVTSQQVLDFKNSKARTLDWVSVVSETEFYSPSIPRSELGDDDDGLSEPSDVESSHSIPPRLMLRYGDGRPDVPIPHVHDISPNRDAHSVSRSQTYPQSSRSGSDVPSQTRSRGYETLISSVPEEIRILPSRPVEGSRSGSFHSRSKSLPRNAYNPVQSRDADTPQIVSRPLYSPRFMPPPPKSSHGPPQPSQWQAYNEGAPPRSHRHPPPSIIYAPSNHHHHANYHPPAIYSHPPNVGPNGMIYSHSAPVPNTQHSTHHRSGDGQRSKRSRTRSSGRHHNASTPTLSESGDSGSTYYVVPTSKQKVHALRTPDLTRYASSSTSKSPVTPVTPVSAGSSNKKPFFHKLFHFADIFSSAGSSKGSSRSVKHIHRRHSTEYLKRP